MWDGWDQVIKLISTYGKFITTYRKFARLRGMTWDEPGRVGRVGRVGPVGPVVTVVTVIFIDDVSLAHRAS